MEHGEPTEYLVAHLAEALARDERVGEQGLRVRVDEGARQVVISGEVATEERRRAVGVVAAELAPGYAVSNEVTVPGGGEPASAEVLA